MPDYKVCQECGTKNYATKTVFREEQHPMEWSKSMVLEEHRFDRCGHLDPDYPTYMVGYKYITHY